MKTREIHPARRVRGETSLPGDKSLAHRFALVASVADGVSRADNFPVGADCASTLRCLEGLGVPIIRRNGTIEIEGRGFGGLVAPNRDLDAGNSGTTVRLLSGILVGQSFSSTLVGDASLGSRPMGRIIEPLRRFGADIQADDDSHLPLRIRGGRLRAIEYRLPMASAQVKSAILLAGLQAQGTTVVTEPTRTRDHTEIALRESGARIRVSDGRIEIDGEDIYAEATDVIDLRRRVGMIFQKSNPFPMSVYDNVAYGVRVNDLARNSKEIDRIVESTLQSAALWDEVKDRLGKSALSLSGGQQQRLCIARALAVRPEILLMDEPASALDPISTAKIEELIYELKRDYTIVIVTHNMQQAARVSDETAFFLSGRLVELSDTKQLFTMPSERETEDYITGRFG